MADNVQVDILFNGKDNASQVIAGVEGKAVSAAKNVQVNWGSVNASLTNLTLSFQAISGVAAEVNTKFDRLSMGTGMTRDKMRELVLATADASLTIGECTVAFGNAKEQGLRTGDEMKRFAGVWDMVSEATGESIDGLTEASVGLKAVGIDANHSQDALAAMGYIVSKTNFSVGDFLTMLGRSGREMQGLNLSVNDSAAVLTLLQQKFGSTARETMGLFNTAVTQAKGDQTAFFQALGLTKDQVGKLRTEVDSCKNAIAEKSAVVRSHITEMQKLKSWIEETKARYSDWFEMLGNAAPVMYAATALISSMTLASNLYSVATSIMTAVTNSATVAWIGFNVTTGGVLIAIGLIVAGVAALALAWSRDMGGIKEKAGAVWTDLKGIFDALKNYLSQLVDWFRGKFQEHINLLYWLKDSAVAIITSIFSVISTVISTWVESLVAPIMLIVNHLPGEIGNKLRTFANDLKTLASGAVTGVGEAIRSAASNPSAAMTDIVNMFKGKSEEAVAAVNEETKKIPPTVKQNTDPVIIGTKNTMDEINAAIQAGTPAIISSFDQAGGSGRAAWDSQMQGMVGDTQDFISQLDFSGGGATYSVNVGQMSQAEKEYNALWLQKQAEGMSADTFNMVYGWMVPDGGWPREAATMAEGGIVNRPTLALIGESGPEAVVPLSGGGMGNIILNINFQSTLTPSDAEMKRVARDFYSYIDDERKRRLLS
jgi:gas vesicle protein